MAETPAKDRTVADRRFNKSYKARAGVIDNPCVFATEKTYLLTKADFILLSGRDSVLSKAALGLIPAILSAIVFAIINKFRTTPQTINGRTLRH